MKFTGERFIPDSELGHEIEIEHFQRYYSIKDLVKNKIVIDAACGDGYGSFIMSEEAAKVYGIDISEEAIKSASLKYKRKNLSFINASIEKLPFDDNSVDIIVSFETIEHVDSNLQNKFLKEVRRVLKEDGIIVISTPDKKVYSDKYNYTNKFHVNEFYKEEFIKFLNKEFKFLKIYYQYFEVVSLLDDLNSNTNIKAYSLSEEKHDGKYLVVLASNKELEGYEQINSMFKYGEEKYAKLIDRILQLQGEVEDRSQWGINLDKELKEKDTKILELNSNIIADEKKLIEARSELKLNLEKLSNTQKKLDIIKKQLQEKKVEIDKKQLEINNKQGHIELLLESERELERIKNSRSWRYMSYFWKVRDGIIPYGSKRRLLIKIGVKAVKHPVRFAKKCTPKRISKFFYYLNKEGASNVSLRLDECIVGNLNERLNLNLLKVNENKVYTIDDFDKLIFKKEDNPKVSIIIPVYNQIHYTYACLESILKNTKNTLYEIIIANDCSTDITTDIDKFVENIKIVTPKENLRFLRNCNNAAKFAKGEYILFLNNDTQVQENWLDSLVELIESDDSIGMVGSKLVYPDGRLQEAGGIIWDDASGWNFGRLSDPQSSEYCYVKECDYISGASMMIKHELWNEIGGFDDRFAPAYYEDTDLAFEVRKHGYKVMLQPSSVVVHFEGISNGTDINSGQKSYQAINLEKFKDKWKYDLSNQFKNGTDVFLAKDRSKNKKHILVIDHYVPHHDKDAGGKCTYMYLKLFVSLGMKVTFLGDNFYPHQPYTSELQQMGIEVLYGDYYYNNWKKWLAENGKYFDYVYLNRPHISVKYIDLVKEYTNAKVIYFGHDLHYLREYREYKISGDKSKLKSSNEWKEKEFSLFNKADIIHVVGNYEQEILKKQFKNKPIRNIPVYIYDKVRDDVNKNFKERQNIIFVGGFGHPPNADAVLWFAEKIFPSILKKYPDIVWYIVGSKPPESIQKLASKNIVVTGFISDQELSSLYEKCRIAVVPLRVGAGVKGKVIEAMYNQIPLITTSIGAEGLSLAEEAFIVADKEEEFIDAVLNIYEDYDKLEELSNNSINFIKNYFTVETAKNIILADIKLDSQGE